MTCYRRCFLFDDQIIKSGQLSSIIDLITLSNLMAKTTAVSITVTVIISVCSWVLLATLDNPLWALLLAMALNYVSTALALGVFYRYGRGLHWRQTRDQSEAVAVEYGHMACPRYTYMHIYIHK